MEIILIITLALLAAGVIGSFLPLVPGSLISIAGISIYWWNTGFTQPGILPLILMYLTALTALVFDLFAGAIGSKAGGASSKTVQMAAIAGVIFFFVAGPVGTIVGITAVVLIREYLLTGDTGISSRAAFYTIISVLGSAIIQGVLAGLTLAIFILTLII
ncbi:MAG: hypothetical protein ACI9LV_000615 [Candidatus Nanohaloarchaea archaeon]|jgi:uncharacterized protein YqgC (DUF456 family)